MLGIVAIGLAAVAPACSSDPAVIESVDASTTVVSTTTHAAPSTSESAQPSSTEAPTSVAPTTAAPTTTSSTTTSSTTTTTAAVPLDEVIVTPLGPFHLPEGEFVKLTDPEVAADPDAECIEGRLAVRSEGEIAHVYDDLGDIFGVEVYPGPFGQTALVESCEESIMRILFTSTAVPPPDGIPLLTSGNIPENVFFLSEMGWHRTGLFHARATYFDDTGWNDDVVFHAFDGRMESIAEGIGERVLLDNGVEFILPTTWEIADGDPALDVTSIVDTESPAAVTITVFPGSVPPAEPLIGETLLDETTVYVEFWDDIDGARARTSGLGDVVDEMWFDNPEGTRLVRTIPVESDRVVRIEAFTPAAAGAYNEFLPELILDHVRVFTTVG